MSVPTDGHLDGLKVTRLVREISASCDTASNRERRDAASDANGHHIVHMLRVIQGTKSRRRVVMLKLQG